MRRSYQLLSMISNYRIDYLEQPALILLPYLSALQTKSIAGTTGPQRWIEEQTGVKPMSYDYCRKSCMSFSMYPDMGECDYCKLPRWKEVHKEKRVPFATHEYIPITHRLKL